MTLSRGRASRRDTAPASPMERQPFWVAAFVAVMAAVPRLMTVGYGFSGDEYRWMNRIVSFSDAFRHGHPSHMSASYPTDLSMTMPGIPTMWLGSLGWLVWKLGTSLGIIHATEPFLQSASGYMAAEAMVALATSLLIALLVWLVAKWTSVWVAGILGVVVATEPFWVALGAILHLDELVTLFAMTGLVALAWALGLPDERVMPIRPRRWAIVAAVLCVLSPLTKLSGVAIAPAAIGMVAWAIVREIRSRPDGTTRWAAARPTCVTAGLMVVAALVTVAVTYPALLVDPITQYHALRRPFDIVTNPRETFFLGRIGGTADARFYPYTLAYVVTWWLFLLLPIAVLAALIRRRSRTHALIVLGWAILPAASIVASDASYPRYGLIVLGPLVLVGALSVYDWHPRLLPVRTWAPRLAIAGGTCAFAWSVWTAPWGLVTFNPLATRVRPPIRTFELGWGEAPAAALPMIEDHARAHGRSCADITVAAIAPSVVIPFPKGPCQPKVVPINHLPDYAYVPIRWTQKFPDFVRGASSGMDFLGIAKENGQPVAVVWQRIARGPTRAGANAWPTQQP